MYKCAECGVTVECKQDGGEVVFVRECEHKDAAVIAELSATVYGDGAAQ